MWVYVFSTSFSPRAGDQGKIIGPHHINRYIMGLVLAIIVIIKWLNQNKYSVIFYYMLKLTSFSGILGISLIHSYTLKKQKWYTQYYSSNPISPIMLSRFQSWVLGSPRILNSQVICTGYRLIIYCVEMANQWHLSDQSNWCIHQMQ